MKSLLNLFLAIICVGLAGCTDYPLGDEREDIVAVWKHDVNQYSVTLNNGEELIDNGFSFYKGEYFSYRKIKVVPDVPEGKSMWYEASYIKNANANRAEVKIHVHSEKDINAAGWNHGKFGKGMLEKIE